MTPRQEMQERRDVGIINRNAERLNREAADTLEYQEIPGIDPELGQPHPRDMMSR